MPKVINKKKRKFKITTPGQVRDFEILVKNRRFQKYEEGREDWTTLEL